MAISLRGFHLSEMKIPETAAAEFPGAAETQMHRDGFFFEVPWERNKTPFNGSFNLAA